MNKNNKIINEEQIFKYTRIYYKNIFNNFKNLTEDGKKLDSPDLQNQIDSIGVEIVQVLFEEKAKRYSYFDKYLKNKVRDYDKYKNSIIYSKNQKPMGIFAPIITGDSSLKFEKILIIKNIKAKLKKLPKYKQFRINSLFLDLDVFIDFRYFKNKNDLMKNFFKSCISEAEEDFLKTFDVYLFHIIAMKQLVVLIHDKGNNFIYEEYDLE